MPISSQSRQSFLLNTTLDGQPAKHPSLVDCGATRCFIDKSLAHNLPHLVHKLSQPIALELFDGEATSGGLITECLTAATTFDDGTTHNVSYLVTKLHPTAPIVLGMPWLVEFNPDINWATFSINLHRARLSAAIPLLPNSNDLQGPRLRARKTTIEELMDEDARPQSNSLPLAPGIPILAHIDDDFTSSIESVADKPLSSVPIPAVTDPPSTTPNVDIPQITTPFPDSAAATHGTASEATSPQNRRAASPSPLSPIERAKLKKRRSTDRLFFTKAKTDERPSPNRSASDKAPHIRLVGAAPFAALIRDGAETFTLHISPSTAESVRTTPAAEALRGEQSGEPEPKPVLTEQEVLEKFVPQEYREFADVFSEGEARDLPPHRPYDHTIDLDEGSALPVGRVYNMSERELKALKDYIDEMLGKGFIRASNSPSGAPVLFAKKKDGSLRLCVDYRGLNRITRKNRYPLPLIGNLVDQLRAATLFTKFDLRHGYNNVRIAPGDEWKTAFRTRYGSFEYLVMPFGMTNSPATFQYFMNDIFQDMVDVCVVIYLDDILVFSNSLEEHRVHVRQVLTRLREHNLHARPEKCSFHTTSVEYLGVIITPEGVSMDPKKVQAILDWPAPRSIRELQSFLGFANFYRRFIDNYSGIVKPLTRLLRKDVVWAWSDECAKVFNLLKKCFTTAPILRHFDPNLPIILECDASDYAIAGIISQFDPVAGDIRPVAFHTRTMINAELNYDIYDKELLAIVEGFKEWRAYLEGSQHTIQVYSDHNNLQYFTTTKQLSRRQARWSEYLSGFDFNIQYRAGRLGAKPDALTRRPDVYPKKSFTAHANAFNNKVLIPPERLAANVLLKEEILLSRIRTAPHDEFFDLHSPPIGTENNSPYSLSDDNTLLLRNGRIYVPDYGRLRLDIMQAYHDHKLRGHPGIRKTKQLIMRDYFWPHLTRDVTNYVRTCHECKRAKGRRHKPYGYLKPLPIGERPWSSISMDHIVGLPTSEGYNAVLVVICRLTKQAIFIPCHKTDDTTEFVKLFITHVFSKHGMPADIVSDRGSVFVSHFWRALCKALDITSNVSTAYHPETDGQTERVNAILEQYLRHYISYDQDDWVQFLPLAEFVYNNTPHSATGVTPFFANKGYHPRLSISFDNLPNHAAHLAARELKELQTHLRDQISVANEHYSKFADKRRDATPTWSKGDLVWLDTKNIKTKRPMKKLDQLNLGPFPIAERVGTHAYRLELPPSLRYIHDVFHVNLLEKHHVEHYPHRRQEPPPPIIIDGEPEYEVDHIVNSRTLRGRVVYKVRWKGYSPEDDTEEPFENIADHAFRKLRDFHEKWPRKPRALEMANAT